MHYRWFSPFLVTLFRSSARTKILKPQNAVRLQAKTQGILFEKQILPSLIGI